MRAVYFETLRRIERGGYDVFSRDARAKTTAGHDRAATVAMAGMTNLRRRRRRRRLRRPERGRPAGQGRRPRARARGARAGSADARPRSRIGRRASSWTTASTSCSAAITRRFGSCATSARSENVQLQRAAGGDDDRPRAAGRSRLDCPALPPPFHLLAGVFDWDALSWRDRLSLLGMARPLRIARAGAAGRRPAQCGVAGTKRSRAG